MCTFGWNKCSEERTLIFDGHTELICRGRFAPKKNKKSQKVRLVKKSFMNNFRRQRFLHLTLSVHHPFNSRLCQLLSCLKIYRWSTKIRRKIFLGLKQKDLRHCHFFFESNQWMLRCKKMCCESWHTWKIWIKYKYVYSYLVPMGETGRKIDINR